MSNVGRGRLAKAERAREQSLSRMEAIIVDIVKGAGKHGMAQAHIFEPMVKFIDLAACEEILDTLVKKGRITKRGAHYFSVPR